MWMRPTGNDQSFIDVFYADITDMHTNIII